MDSKQLALLRVTEPEKYKQHMEMRAKLEKAKYPKLESNRVGPWNEKTQDYEYVARMYGGYTKDKHRVVEADGSYYTGTIKTRKVSRKRLNGDGNFWQTYYELGDGRWFDNSGILCEKPAKFKEDTVDENTEE
jgi:hypothetical protein